MRREFFLRKRTDRLSELLVFLSKGLPHDAFTPDLARFAARRELIRTRNIFGCKRLGCG
jgi:hypothetical protein